MSRFTPGFEESSSEKPTNQMCNKQLVVLIHSSGWDFAHLSTHIRSDGSNQVGFLLHHSTWAVQPVICSHHQIAAPMQVRESSQTQSTKPGDNFSPAWSNNLCSLLPLIVCFLFYSKNGEITFLAGLQTRVKYL